MPIKRLKKLSAALIGFSCVVYNPWGPHADKAYLCCLFVLHVWLRIMVLPVKHTNSSDGVELLQ